MKTRSIVLTLLLAAAPFAANAQKIFMCKDASGRTITSDRPIPECGDRTVKELDSRGIVRNEIKPPPTAAEKEQMKRDEEKKKADAVAAAERKRSDNAILARFRTEADIGVARKRDTDLVQDQIKRETGTVVTLEKRKKDVEAQLRLPEVKGKKEVVANLDRSIAEIEQSIANSKRKVTEYEAEIAQINAKYDGTVQRYRELTGATAAAAPAPAAAPAAK